jgi:4-hydroxyphenylpyruvate dioxygenase
MENSIGMQGIDFVEFGTPSDFPLEEILLAFGFSKRKEHHTYEVDYFQQNDIHFFLNQEKHSKADTFSQIHGPSISSLGLRFREPKKAYQLALQRGAKAIQGDFFDANKIPVPAIKGIGGMLIYFMGPSDSENGFSNLGFIDHSHPIIKPTKGFLKIDHMTNNVEKGTMNQWANFYKDIFGFTEVRYFDIRGAKTGLTSYALRSPCGSFCIPINEATESKSQINEYLEEYKGPGVQHLAFLTDDIIESLDLLKDSPIKTLNIDDEYYQSIFKKFPELEKDAEKIRAHNVLIDGDENGYLLQIFTKNIIGPIFIEIIQRNNHYSFGEGNFGALFRSLERDQIERGYLS